MCTIVDGIIDAVLGLVLDVKRLDSLTGLFKQVRIEGEHAFKHFFRPVLLVCVHCCEAAAGVADDDRVAEEDLVFGRDIVENRGDGGQANVQRIQRMLDDRPEVQAQQELQILITSRQLSASEGDDVENRLAHGIKHHMSLRILVPCKITSLDVSVRPIAELVKIILESFRRQEAGPRQET